MIEGGILMEPNQTFFRKFGLPSFHIGHHFSYIEKTLIDVVFDKGFSK